MSFVVAASRQGYQEMATRLATRLQVPVHFIGRREDFTVQKLAELAPELVFLPHWSYRVPAEIHRAHECVMFHMTDLPFGRGGTPLQNLISRGHTATVLTAFRCTEEMDAGPVYLKHSLSLEGRAEEIYARGAALVEEMIQTIMETRPEPQPQQGEPVLFPRRRPEQSDLTALLTGTDSPALNRIFDHIRMLDAAGYPHAYLDVGAARLEFTEATLAAGQLTAQVRFVFPDEVKK